ncbi:MAG TPA: hypothetical protein VN729_09160 [Ktedonobacteraceae bacterium]|nr:hypothetical protein [Ktedonobacteraceae bacterium]
MAGWQEELAELLRELGVSPEEPQTNLRSKSKPLHSDAGRRLCSGKSTEHLADTFFTDDVESDEAEAYTMDLGAMGREVDSIVQQVIRLTRNGELDLSAKEDILEVLRALRKFSIVAQEVAPGDEAYLESVSAMLRFCRLVLRLSETTIEGF